MTLACIAATGVIAGLFALMATSLDPMQMINAGTEPWTDLLSWTGAFLGLSVVAALGLRLWHTRHLRPIALLLLAAQLGFVGWALDTIYTDYF